MGVTAVLKILAWPAGPSLSVKVLLPSYSKDVDSVVVWPELNELTVVRLFGSVKLCEITYGSRGSATSTIFWTPVLSSFSFEF